jgi:hypothetical protein
LRGGVERDYETADISSMLGPPLPALSQFVGRLISFDTGMPPADLVIKFQRLII